MSTDVLDEHRFSSQCSLYESFRNQSSKEVQDNPTKGLSTTLFKTTPTYTTNTTRSIKYATQTSTPSNQNTTNSIHTRHSVSTDLISLIRTYARKPFKTSSMTNTMTEGQTNNVIGGNNTRTKSSVNLLKYRPLSDSVSEYTNYTGSIHQTENFLKRMGWPVNSSTDEARIKWKIAMKFLIPVKFDVNRAIELYRAHENIRKNENLDHIWINNPHLIREIQTNKFFSLRQLQNQPLNVCFTAANLIDTISTNSLSQQERELIALQSLICQLDVATESIEVQENGLNFIYNLQNCSASQFDINISKKILKLLQGGYPAMVKNIFIISAPKWFKIAYKVTMYTPEQMREYFINQYGYSLEEIPETLGGLLDVTIDTDKRYQLCLSTVTNSQSICYPYYTIDSQVNTTKSSRNILYFNTDHHHHQSQDTAAAATTTTTASSPASLVAIVALKRNHESSSQVRVRKRESSSSSNDSEKRQRSCESLIEEESPTINSLTYIPQEILFE